MTFRRRVGLFLLLLSFPKAAAADNITGVCVSGCYIPPPPSGSSSGSSGGTAQPGGIPQTEEEQLRALIDSAEALLQRGKYDLALSEVEEALALRPGDVEAMALRSRIRLAAGYTDTAPGLTAGGGQVFDSGPPAAAPVAVAPAAAAPAAAPPPPPTPTPKPNAVLANLGPASAEQLTTSVVDARGQTVDLRLPIPEQILNSPALGEWRKAMDAVAKRDWAVAAAWFKQGLNKDPANDALIRAADLADFTLRQRQQEEGAKGALQLIDQAFAARDAGDFKRQDAILAQIRNDPRYQDPGAQRWRDLVFEHLEERSLEGGPKPVAQMTEAEKTELLTARLMGEFFAEDCQRIGNAALLAGRTPDAKVAFQAAAALAPHIPYYRRTAETLSGAQ